MQDIVYLDYAATTPLDPRVLTAMDAAAGLVGNPSSTHRPGREARAAVDLARGRVAKLFGATAAEVVFASGATEANGSAVRGVLRAVRASHPGQRFGIVSSGVEHSSIDGTIEAVVADGEAAAVRIPPGRDGVMRAADVAAAIDGDTVLVCMMWVNNVLGTVQPVAEVARAVADERGRRGPGGLPIVFLCDAVQAASSLPVSGGAADIVTLSAHKMYGPKGVGAMRIAAGTPFSPVFGGGGQEGGLRHGTEDVAGIVGFGEAARILVEEETAERERLKRLRTAFLAALADRAPRAARVGADGVPGTVFLRLTGVRGDEAALKLDAAGFAVSAGSACDAGTRHAPRLLSSVLDERGARDGGVRISFGRFTSEEDLVRCAAAMGGLR